MAAKVTWRGFEFQKQVFRSVGESLDRSAIAVQTEIKKQLNAAASAPGSPPAKQTGTLGRSVQIDRSKIGELRISIGPDIKLAPYARIQELGGTIRPKNAKALAIPLNDQARKLRRGVRSLREIKSLRLIGNGILALVRGSKVTPMYVLKPSVTLPSRPYVRPGLRAAMPAVRHQMSAGTILGRVKL